MPKLKVLVQSQAPNTDVTHDIANLKLAIDAFIPVPIQPAEMVSQDTPNALTVGSDGKLVASAVTLSAKDLISSDADNDLKLGSDDKLLSQPGDIDFLAHYILASN